MQLFTAASICAPRAGKEDWEEFKQALEMSNLVFQVLGFSVQGFKFRVNSEFWVLDFGLLRSGCK